MAIPTSIKTLLSGDVVEWARIELKQTWDPAASLHLRMTLIIGTVDILSLECRK